MRTRSQSGFTLVELLIVVLIIGILATIAIPVFNGQRDKAKNAAAQSAVRIALSAATVLAVNDSDSFDGVDSAKVAIEDKSLVAGTGTQDAPGAISVAPNKVWVYSVTNAATADTTVQSGSVNGIVLCTSSKGSKMYCLRSLRKTIGTTLPGTTYSSGGTLSEATTNWSTAW